MFTGIVEKGTQQARTFGTPTANIHSSFFCLEPGVYVGELQHNSDVYKACIYTSDGKKIEAYAINQTLELYGEKITIIVKEKIRDSLYFSDLSLLKEQIQKDVQACLAL